MVEYIIAAIVVLSVELVPLIVVKRMIRKEQEERCEDCKHCSLKDEWVGK